MKGEDMRDFDFGDLHRMNWEVLGAVAVDSGTLMVVDPCYVLSAKDTDPKVSYDDMLDAFDATEDPNRAVLVEPWSPGAGLCITTTHGDGQYTVYGVKDRHGRVQAWMVVTEDMAEPEDEDEDEEIRTCANCGRDIDYYGEDKCDRCLEKEGDEED